MPAPTFTKSFQAVGAIAPYRVAAFTGPDGAVQQAASATDPLVGAADGLGGSPGSTVDVDQGGWSEVQAGGPIAAGDPLTSDANGCAVKAAPAAGATANCIGIAQVAAVAGDVLDYLVAPFVLRG